ncbi:hypothetical protein AAHC03_09334 [Spirometra sp. Aus1]
MSLQWAKASQLGPHPCANSCTPESCYPPTMLKIESPGHFPTGAGIGSVVTKFRRWGFSTLGLILTVGLLALSLPLDIPPHPSSIIGFQVCRLGPQPI